MSKVDWKVRAIRGATTVSENTVEAIREAVSELIEAIEQQNDLDLEDIVSVIFTVTPDLDAIFPASIARARPHWQHIPLLDVQQLQVQGSLARCIRVLLSINTPKLQTEIKHLYLREAKDLRPDWNLTNQSLHPSS
jgi:chorismate mutase